MASHLADLLLPSSYYEGQLKKQGLVPRDHMKENRVQLRDNQHKNRIEAMEKEANMVPDKLYKLGQFQNVSARVFEESKKEPYRQLDGEFLRRGTLEIRNDDRTIENKMARNKLERKLEDESKAQNLDPPTPRKAAIPNGPAKLAEKSNTDFISRNRVDSVAVARAPARNNNREQDDGARHKGFGRVPTYLEHRKQQWADEEEERIRNAPDPNCPRGMVAMPEQERVDTLNVLRNSLKEATNQLSAMPFVIETPSLRRKHDMLEAKIKEMENAIGLFSRSKVYIAK